MSLSRVFLLLFSFLALMGPAQAEIFKYYDSKGNLVLTDTPPKDKSAKVERVESKPVMTIPALKGSPSKPAADDAKAKANVVSYKIVIQSPLNDATFRPGDDAIQVSAAVTPSLAPEHQLVFRLDGAELSESSTIQVDSLDRGSHQLLVAVQDAAGKVLTSVSSTFYLQSHSVLGPTAPKPKPVPKH